MLVVSRPLTLHYQSRASALCGRNVLANTNFISVNSITRNANDWSLRVRLQTLVVSSDAFFLSLFHHFQYKYIYNIHCSFFSYYTLPDITHTRQIRMYTLLSASITHYLHNYKNAAHASPLKWCCLLGNRLYPSLASLIPIPPFNTSRGKRSLVNTVQHFCASMEFWWHNLIS